MAKNLKPVQFALGLLVGLGGIWYFASHDGQPATGPADVTAAPRAAFVPEDAVAFNGTGFSCSSRDDFEEAVTHAVRGEKSLLSDMFDTGCCGQLPTSVVFKVLHVERTMIEVRTESIPDHPVAVWTAPEFLVHWGVSDKTHDPVATGK